MELNAFDLLQIELVHGWLLESSAQEYEWVGDKVMMPVRDSNNSQMSMIANTTNYQIKRQGEPFFAIF
jgi:hypothetical protein